MALPLHLQRAESPPVMPLRDWYVIRAAAERRVANVAGNDYLRREHLARAERFERLAQELIGE